MERKTLQVYNPVRKAVDEVKTIRNFKNDSETIAYLIALYETFAKKITLDEHDKVLKRKDEILNQETL